MDSDFWNQLRQSHDVSGKFRQLAEQLSIGEDPDTDPDVEETCKQIKDSAGHRAPSLTAWQRKE